MISFFCIFIFTITQIIVIQSKYSKHFRNDNHAYNNTSIQQKLLNTTQLLQYDQLLGSYILIDNHIQEQNIHELMFSNNQCIHFHEENVFKQFIQHIKDNENIKITLQQHIKTEKQLYCARYEPIRHNNIFKDWRYGNWCGIDYGGFDGPCEQKCLEDKWHPSKDCVECCEPMDYLDEQCMFHDFCQERFEKYHIGSDICKTSLTMGGKFPTPCNCSEHLMDSLSMDKLLSNCNHVQCVTSGYGLRQAVDNIIMECGCTFKQCDTKGCHEQQICTDPQTCQSFGGV